MLGLATSALSLQQMLPAAAADCLQTRHFQLVQVRSPPADAPPQLVLVQPLPGALRTGHSSTLIKGREAAA